MAINEPWCSGNIVLQLLPTTYGSTRGGNVFTDVCDSVKRRGWGGGMSCPAGGGTSCPGERGRGLYLPSLPCSLAPWLPPWLPPSLPPSLPGMIRIGSHGQCCLIMLIRGCVVSIDNSRLCKELSNSLARKVDWF